jgi:hypothetical protein
MFDIMYPQSEDVSSFLLMDGVYTGLFIVSVVAATGLFLWGLLGKKHALFRNIIGAELLLLFLFLLLDFSRDCFMNLKLLLHMGISANMLVMYLCSYLFNVFILSAVSLYKLTLVLLLCIKIAVKRKKAQPIN